MINLSRISLTKNLGCPFTHSCEAVSGLEANGHERTHTPPDLDPFAFLKRSPTLLHCRMGLVQMKRLKTAHRGRDATIRRLFAQHP